MINHSLFVISASTTRRVSWPTRCSQDGDDSDSSDAEWRQYLKLEADDETGDVAGTGGSVARASVIRRDATGDWATTSSDVATDDHRPMESTGRSDERQRTDTGPRTFPSPYSQPTSSVKHWTSASSAKSERHNDRNIWSVY